MAQVTNQTGQLQGMALLLQLQRMARSSEDTVALGFNIVNETRLLLNYRQAALWIKHPLSRIVSVSGVALADSNAPYIVWLKRMAEMIAEKDLADQPHRIDAQALPADLFNEWLSWSPRQGLWLPMRVASDSKFGGLLLFREEPWQDADILLLTELMDAYAHAWSALSPRHYAWHKQFVSVFKKRWLLPLPLLFLIPVQQSVLAPAEIIPTDPTLVRAPLDGVVDLFHVQPNEQVSEGQILVSLENTDLANRLDIARKALAVADTEYRSAAQLALLDNRSKAELNVLKGKIDQHLAEVNYMEDQLVRSQIKAPHAGIAIYTDAQDWLGKPVTVGERILQIANPEQVQVQIHLPVADLINFDQNAETVMFLNSDPEHPLNGELYYASYEAELTEENILTYRLKAHLNPDQPLPRIGLKGTSKIYGPRVSLFYYVFRRPLAAFRQWLGV